MNKQEFLSQLREALAGLPAEEREERLTFYREMIDDRMEEGFSEEEAVRQVGTIDEIVAQIKADNPLLKFVKQRIRKKRSTWEIVLLAIGSPVWLSLLIAAFAVLLSLYISLWAVIVSLWAVFAAVAACALGVIAGGIVLAFAQHYPLTGIAAIGAGLVCAGLSILLFFGCQVATKGGVLLTGTIVRRFLKKGVTA